MAAAIATAADSLADVDIVAFVGPNEADWDSGTTWFSSLSELSKRPDFLIDFTLPEGTRTAAAWCAENGVPMVSGVTGLPDDIAAALETAGANIPVLWSPNLSLGVNLLADLAQRAASILGSGVPVHIDDVHHQWKKDAPSGTALMLGERVAEGRGGDASGIDFSSVREGEVVGVHTVTFRLNGEEFDLVHRAHDRSIYAFGAIQAGRWLLGKTPGLYTARDWLASV